MRHSTVYICIPVDAGTFMIASEEEYILWILHLVSQYQTDSLQWHFTSKQKNQQSTWEELRIDNQLLVYVSDLPIYVITQE